MAEIQGSKRPMTAGPNTDDVVEYPLLLPRGLAEALENAAHQQGVSPGRLLRRMIAVMLGLVPPATL